MTSYSKDKKNCEDLLEVLEPLLEKKATFHIHSTNPKRLAMLLRAAIYAAQFHEEFKQYAHLKKLYSFEVHKDFVRARYRPPAAITKLDVRPGETKRTRTSKGPKKFPKTPVPDPEPVISKEEIEAASVEIQEAMKTCTIPRVDNIAGVIEGAKRFGAKVLEVFYPDTRLTQEDLARLYRWTSESEWTLIDMEEAGLTLSKKDVPEEVRWRPTRS